MVKADQFVAHSMVFQKWRSTEIDVTLGLILMVSQSQE